MVQCGYCLREMKEAEGCNPVPFRFVGDEGEYQPIKYGDEADDWGPGRCHDCACLPGHYHHVGCDLEQCPRCGGQAIGCDCELDVEAH